MEAAPEEHYCVRWKGFHSNIVSALEDLKTDEAFVDVSLSCDGHTIQGHKVILSACSPYFKKILRDNPCRHPVLILNDMDLEVLEALVTYMYHGTVSVPQNRLQSFLQTAEALKIKGIVDTSSESELPAEPLTRLPPVPVLARAPSLPLQHHPAGDLSLLARAATEPQAQLEGGPAAGGGVKRRKTAPRKLATYLTSNSNSPSQPPVEEEEEEREKENQDLLQGLINRENLLQQANKLMLPVNLSNNSNNKCPTITNFPTSNNEPTSLDLSLPRSSPPRPSSAASSPPASPPSSTLSLLSSLQQQPSATSASSPLNLLHVDGVSAADQMAALLGPEQMAALLGPSWKSRQPRMCQYCQRMFSNKFNLKQHILNMHTVGRELACEICQKKVKNKWYLRRHHVTHHGAPLKK